MVRHGMRSSSGHRVALTAPPRGCAQKINLSLTLPDTGREPVSEPGAMFMGRGYYCRETQMRASRRPLRKRGLLSPSGNYAKGVA